MSTVRYSKYELKQGNQSIVTTNFSQPLEIDQQHLQQVIRDFAFVTKVSENPVNYQSVVEITTSQDTVRIERDYQKQTSQLTSNKQSDPNFFWLPDEIADSTIEDRNESVVFSLGKEQLRNDLIRILPKINKSPNPEFNLSKQEIEEKLANLIGADAKKLIDTNLEITKIETELETQRQVDEAQISKSDLTEKLKDIGNTLAEVEDLVENQKKIYASLRKHAEVLGKDVINKAEILKKEVENIRKQKLAFEIELVSKKTLPNSHEPQQKPKFAKYLLLVLPLVLVALSLFGFFLTGSYIVIALGLIGGIIESLLYLAVNAVEPEVVVSSNQIEKLATQNTVSLKQNLQIDGERMAKIEDFFVNKAWLGVLQTEFKDLHAAINSRLGNKDLTQVQKTKNEVETELNRINQMIADHEGKDIPPEKYLKYRRQLDMLKMEQSKIQSEIVEDKRREVDMLLSMYQLRNNVGEGDKLEEANTFILDVQDKYAGVKVEKGDLLGLNMQTGKWEQSIPEEELFVMFVYAKILKYQQKPGLPLVFVDLEKQLPAKAINALKPLVSKIEAEHQVVHVLT